MTRDIIAFEWRYHTRQASFYAAALLFSFIAFALASTGFGPESLPVNSPFLVMESLGFVSLLSVFAVAVFASNAALRDQEHRMQEIVYCTPVGRFEFLLGRFTGAFLATLTAMSFSIPVLLLGTYMPWQEPERIAAFDPIRYLWAFGVLTVPNVLFAAALLFAIAFLTRNALWTYAGAVFIYFAYFAVAALTNSPLMAASTPGASSGATAAIFDPFGFSAFFEVTRYWPIAAKSTRLVPLSGLFLYNRLVCVAGAVVVLGVVYWRFSFRLARRPIGAQASSLPVSGRPRSPEGRGPAGLRPALLASYFSATKFELRIFWSKPVLLLLLLWLGLAASEIWSELHSGEYGRVLYPATGVILDTLRTPLQLVGMILIIYYGAEIFWREQRDRMASIIDTTPVSGAVMIAAKWTAMAALIAAVIFAGIVPGIALQVVRGHSDIQPLVYLSLFYFSGLPLLLLGALALFVHSLSPGKYAGMIGALLVILIGNRAPMIGLDHPLWRFAGAPPVRYTDLNGFGHDAAPFNSLMLHWSAMALLFVVIAAALWRKIGQPVRERLRALIRHERRAHAAILVVLILITGSWIYYNTDVLSARTTVDELFDWRADYEKTYKKFANLPQPRITAVNVGVDLYPGERRYRVAGEYSLLNDTNAPIRTVFVAVRRNARRATSSMPNARVTIDPKFGIRRFDLHEPLAPGARTKLQFDLELANRGIDADDPDDSIVENGSYLMSLRCMPTLGYRIGYQLRGERARRERGLPGSGETILSEEGPGETEPELDRVDLSTTVSTSRDQTAITAGRLEKSWEQNGRRYFRYKTTAPIFNMMAFVSGRYEIATRRHGDIDVEIYYHPKHGMNVELMLDSAVATLDYCEKNFSPYPSRQLRMIELPSYWDFGGYALPDTVFLVEHRSFLFDTRGPHGPDLVIRRVAHEVAHQWWGHTVMPATTEGASMIVESLTKYTEVMVLERMRGRENARHLLELELERYLTGRSREETGEPPLYKVGSQAYVYYAKGAIVLCAVRDLIGEERLNAALRDLIREHAQHGARATTLDLLKHLPRHPLLEEWMKEITLYDFKVESANATRRADGRYDVTVRIAASKSRADSRGEETAVPFAESIDIGLYEGEAPLLVARRELRTGSNTVTFIVDREPSYVAIDPYVTRIDQAPGDNTKAVALPPHS